MDTSVVVSYFNDIPILDVMNVKGYCVEINCKMRTFLFAKDIAINCGLSFIQKDTKILATSCKNEYINTGIRWNTFNLYAYESLQEIIPYDNELQYLTQLPVNEYSFIPQEIAYLIIMRCNNAKAREFRAKISFIVSNITNKSIEMMREKYEKILKEKDKEMDERNLIDSLNDLTIMDRLSKIRSNVDDINNHIYNHTF